jgi:hypothetical protein
MEGLKNKIKSKINLAYEHITNGYKMQIKYALKYINNFINIGVIPESDSNSNLKNEEEMKKNQEILSELTELFEKNNIPEEVKKVRNKIEKEIKNDSEIKYNYDNYEEIIKKKQKFINENFNKIVKQTIPKMMENINNGIIKAIGKVFNVNIIFENGKLVIKENPSTKDAYIKASGSLALAAAGGGYAYYIGLVAGEEVLKGALMTVIFSAQPGFLPLFYLSGVESVVVALDAFVAFGLGVGALFLGLGLVMYNFSERKKNAYETAIKNLETKFYSIYDGFEKKINQEYNAKKEKTLQDIAVYLNMCYDPIQLDEYQKQNLINEYNYLKTKIYEIIK